MGSATVLAGQFPNLVMGATTASGKSTFKIGGDLTVNRLGYGAMRLTGEGIWGWPPDREKAKKVLRRALELGVDFIDTADAYGPEVNELLIAEALHPYPKGLVIATKGGNTRPGPGQWVPNGRPEYLAQCIDKSLQRLKLERIDLYQLHRIDRNVPVEESLGALKKAQDAGKIRHVGLSEVSVNEIERAKKVLPIVSIQNRYNIEDRDSEEALVYCEKNRMAIHPMGAAGRERGKIIGEGGRSAGSGSEKAQRHRGAACARLVAPPIARDVADSRDIVSQSSRGERGGGEASALGGGMEEGRGGGEAGMKTKPVTCDM